VKGDLSRVMEVKSLNLDLNLLWKDLEMKLGEIIEDYKTHLFSNFQKKRICLWKLWTFEDFVSDLVFWSYLFCLNIFGSAALGSYRS
jgi:hypothetical protein